MTFDLTPLIEFRVSLMVDGCRITADPLGADDDVLDQATGTLTPVADQVVLYDGICDAASVDTVADHPSEQAGREIAAGQYRVCIPLSAPVPAIGNIVEITKAVNDPALLGKRLRVGAVSAGTRSVRRQLLCEDMW